MLRCPSAAVVVASPRYDIASQPSVCDESTCREAAMPPLPLAPPPSARVCFHSPRKCCVSFAHLLVSDIIIFLSASSRSTPRALIARCTKKPRPHVKGHYHISLSHIQHARYTGRVCDSWIHPLLPSLCAEQTGSSTALKRTVSSKAQRRESIVAHIPRRAHEETNE